MKRPALPLPSGGAALEVFAREGFAPFREEWQQRHAHQNQRVSVSTGARRGADGDDLVGDAAGIDVDGALLLRSARGLERIVSGDVSLRRA